jgi:hypothetical protein
MSLPMNGVHYLRQRLQLAQETSTLFFNTRNKCRWEIFLHCTEVLHLTSYLTVEPFMFHQINMRVADVLPTTINGITKQRSLLQMWAETMGPRFVSLTHWPLISLKGDDLFTVFTERMIKDQCNPSTRLIYTTSGNITAITGLIVGCTGNLCPTPIPITIPGGTVTNLQGSTIEQVGNDPMTLWVTLSGVAKTFTLTLPITLA